MKMLGFYYSISINAKVFIKLKGAYTASREMSVLSALLYLELKI
jgi:hypothetical protein